MQTRKIYAGSKSTKPTGRDALHQILLHFSCFISFAKRHGKEWTADTELSKVNAQCLHVNRAAALQLFSSTASKNSCSIQQLILSIISVYKGRLEEKLLEGLEGISRLSRELEELEKAFGI